MSDALVPLSNAAIDGTDPGLPAIVAAAGGAACFVWDEFFTGGIRNPHTRRAYAHAVRRFLAWVEGKGLGLSGITPGLVGQYLDQLAASVPTKKQHLAAIRGFFDALVLRHVGVDPTVVSPGAIWSHRWRESSRSDYECNAR